MSGHTVLTNKDNALRATAEGYFETYSMGNFKVIEHKSKLEWRFDSLCDAIIAANYLCNHFEYCHRF